MPGEIIEELWSIKDGIAREHGYDLRKLAAYLQGLKQWKHPHGSSENASYQIISEKQGQRLYKTGKAEQA